MEIQFMVFGAMLMLVGFVLGRLTAPKERKTVEYRQLPSLPAARSGVPDAAGDAEIQALVQAGQKIQAIRRHRELYGSGLREAKDAIDDLEARLRS